MTPLVYLGDEVSAAGWRLAGARVRVPAPGGEAAALAEATAHAAGQATLLLLSAPVAAALDEALLSRALCALTPLVLIVPDLRGEVPLPDLAGRLRHQLGLEA